MTFKQQAEHLPQTPGCYLFLDKNNKVLYVGKAKNLKKRVRQYVQGHDDRIYIHNMLPKVVKIRHIITENEAEALILEANLIKKYQPYYNADFKDDKSYAWIVITKDPYPRVFKTRKTGLKAYYYGPYPNDRDVTGLLRYIRTVIPYCNCKKQVKKGSSPCLYYHLGLCPGVSSQLITKSSYRKNVQKIKKMLRGKLKSPLVQLRQKMEELAANQQYEKAALIRDRIVLLEFLGQNLQVDSGDDEKAYALLKNNRWLFGLREIASKFKISKDLSQFRAEAYDIAHLAGEFSYGSMVVTIGTQLRSDMYRAFSLDKAKGDDLKALEEVIERRLKRSQLKGVEQWPLPDLILIDGGPTQLKTVAKVVKKYNLLGKLSILAISKGRYLKRQGKPELDQFWYYRTSINRPIKFSVKYPYIWQTLRDESHRFARKFMHNQQKKYSQASRLQRVEGVGVKRSYRLLKQFGSLKAISQAKEKDLFKIVKNKKVVRELKMLNYKS